MWFSNKNKITWYKILVLEQFVIEKHGERKVFYD